jgi:hypothetical protein
MSDDAGTGAPGAEAPHDGEERRQEVIDNLAAAMARLRTAVDRLREEVEANAHAEWVRAKPELRQTIAELQTMIDALAQRAKGALGDLGTRLDGDRTRDGA